MKRLSVLLIFCSLLAGCASIHISEKGEHTLVIANNTCWYLFNWIPMASGNTAHPNEISTCFFSETVTLQNNMKLLETAMRERPEKVITNLNSYTTDESVFFFLLTRHACHTSAELIFPLKDKRY